MKKLRAILEQVLLERGERALARYMKTEYTKPFPRTADSWEDGNMFQFLMDVHRGGPSSKKYEKQHPKHYDRIKDAINAYIEGAREFFDEEGLSEAGILAAAISALSLNMQEA